MPGFESRGRTTNTQVSQLRARLSVFQQAKWSRNGHRISACCLLAVAARRPHRIIPKRIGSYGAVAKSRRVSRFYDRSLVPSSLSSAWTECA